MSQEISITGLVENPEKLISNAAVVAKEFHKIVSGQKMFTTIQGKDHIHADGWSMLGVLLGVFPEVLSTQRVDCGNFIAAQVRRKNSYGKEWKVWTDKNRMKENDVLIKEVEREEIKYSAIIALHTLGGKKLAQVTTLCSNREDGKVDNDEYAIESMAQTRGTGKVYRTAFGWIARMAGYSSTPFEEATAQMFDHEEVAEENLPEYDPEIAKKLDKHLQACKTMEDIKVFKEELILAYDSGIINQEESQQLKKIFAEKLIEVQKVEIPPKNPTVGVDLAAEGKDQSVEITKNMETGEVVNTEVKPNMAQKVADVMGGEVVDVKPKKEEPKPEEKKWKTHPLKAKEKAKQQSIEQDGIDPETGEVKE